MKLKFVKVSVLSIATLLTTHGFSQEGMEKGMSGVKSTVMKPSAAGFGWKYNVDAVLGYNLFTQQNVVGKVNGRNETFNLKLDASLNKVAKSYEWDNSLVIDESITKSTSLPGRFIKGADELKFVSIYKRYLESINWLGLYTRFGLNTSLRDTFDERASEISYSKFDAQGKADGKAEKAERYKMAKAFSPVTLQESIGAIAKVMNKQAATIEVRTGLGAKQIMARNSYKLTLADDKKSAVLNEYGNISVVGWELAVDLKGKAADKKFAYKAYANMLLPLSHSKTPKVEVSDEDKKTNSELITRELGVNLSYAAASWLSLIYDVKVKREPLLLDKTQITNSFIVAANYKIGG